MVLAIDAGRLSVLLGRAREGLDEGAPAGESNEADLVRTDRALRQAALELVALRDEICRRGQLEGEACQLGSPPTWIFDAPEAEPSALEMARRYQELMELMSPFVETGCALGAPPPDGPAFCSVE
jgi:hypothetical protein